MNLTRWPDLLRVDPLDDGLRTMLRNWRVDAEPSAPQMRLDVRELDGQYTVTAEIPGVKKEDLDVRIDGRTVCVSAEVRREQREEPSGKDGERLLRAERSYGFVSREFSLGQEIDQSKAQARYEDGVLELTLPKKASTASHRLSIA